MGGPIGTHLLGRDRRAARPRRPACRSSSWPSAQVDTPPVTTPAGEDVEAYALLKHLVVMLTAVGVGAWVSAGFAALGWTLPAYIGAMVVAAVIRNADDALSVVGHVAARHRRPGHGGAVDLPRDGADDAAAVAAGRGRAAAAHHPGLPGRVRGRALRVRGAAGDGPRLRRRGDVERVLRLHAGHDRQRRGQHGRAGRALRSGAEGLPGGAAGRRVRDRLRERAVDHRRD